MTRIRANKRERIVELLVPRCHEAQNGIVTTRSITFVGRERQCSLLFAKVKRSRKLAALSGNDKTSSQWLEDGGRRGWTHPLLFC